MNMIYKNSPPNQQPYQVRRTQKKSTTELKLALEKIKQTQLEVLKVLRSEAQTSNMTQTEIKQMSENIEANLPYIKSITNVNLLKLAQINQLRKQMETHKGKSQQTINSLQHHIRQLEQQLDRSRQNEHNLKNEKKHLIQELNKAPSQSHNNEELIRNMTINFEQEINEKIKQRAALESQLHNLQSKVNELKQQNQSHQQQNQDLSREVEKMQKNFQQLKKKRPVYLPHDNLILEIKKISSNHQKIYNNLKVRSRVTINDLDTEEQIQQSFSKILRFIQSAQKESQNDMGRMPDSAYINQIKRVELDIVESQAMQRSIADLRLQNNQLKEDKASLKEYARQIEFKLKEVEQSGSQSTKVNNNNGQSMKQYTSIVQELKNQMARIRTEKQELTAIVKKLSETPVRSMEQNGGLKILREQLDQIIHINVQLRKENDGLKAMIESQKLQLESAKKEQRQLESTLEHRGNQIEREHYEKQKLIEEIAKFRKTAEEKDLTRSKQEQKIGQLQKSTELNMNLLEHERRVKSEQLTSMRQQIERVMKENRQLGGMAYRYKMLEHENHVLKQQVMHINSSVIHLWEIKEAEYSNLFDIMESVRNA